MSRGSKAQGLSREEDTPGRRNSNAKALTTDKGPGGWTAAKTGERERS